MNEGSSEDGHDERRALSQRLETVGQLAAGIAHEINTPTQFLGDNLRFVQECCATLLRLTEPGVDEDAADADLAFLREEVPAAIDDCLDGVARIARIVSAMRDFSHPGMAELVEVDVNAVLAGALTISHHSWKYIAEVATEFDPLQPRVLCHKGELHQVVLNLLVNAAHAIADASDAGAPGPGRIEVRSRVVDSWVEVDIADSGAGIPSEVQARIFDTFFTTKAVGRGTGQGLAIARTLVTRAGGSISFSTEQGQGTTFTIRLPRSCAQVGHAERS